MTSQPDPTAARTLALDDQERAAEVAARALVARLADHPRTVLLPGTGGPWCQHVLATVSRPGRRAVCRELATRPRQPAIVASGGLLTCADCFHLGFWSRLPPAGATVRDCPNCQRRIRTAPISPLRVAVAQTGSIIVAGLLCGACLAAEHYPAYPPPGGA